jgi:membrane protease YdiL (CAAX protease family)
MPAAFEAALYALFFAPAVLFLQYRILPALQAGGAPADGLFLQLVLSAGAGVYEELLFRLLLTGALFWTFDRALRLRRAVAGILAVLLSAILFSLFHHVGVFGEPFETHVFLFRLWAGLLLSAIFLLRGLAIAVYTHALYDILLFLQQG